MQLSICSYSFHRLLGDGKQDIFQYITDCADLGCTHLQPWNAHFTRLEDAEAVDNLGNNPGTQGIPAWLAAPTDSGYLAEIGAAARQVGLPFECIAIDRAHIYEETPEARATNRQYAYLWLDIAETLGADSVRIDAGGPQDMPDDAFAIIIDGYNDLIARARDKGISVLTENHWGPTQIPENVVRLLETIDGLGLLFDTNNWAPGRQMDGWVQCAKYASATHIKTFEFDAEGNEPTVDIPKAIRMLVETGYNGIWGVESCPRDGDEMTGARKTIDLISRSLAACTNQ